MSTKSPSVTLATAFSAISSKFRKPLLKYYRLLKSAYAEGQFDACGLRVGKFCETMLRFLQNELTGTHIPFGRRIRNFQEECANLEQQPKTSGVESFRIVIPRAMSFLYTMRNKRDVGHTAGDLDANEIDAAACVRLADWCICELLRVMYALPLEEAQQLLDSIAERKLPFVWEVMGRKRILARGLDYRSQVLLLLYSEPDVGVAAEDLYEWTEHSNKSNFKIAVIGALHKKRLVEHDKDTDFVIISPAGMKTVEDDLLPKLMEIGS
jgi:hypothetical protein